MTVLSSPRHPLITRALADARTWCAGRIIDDRPALVHAVRVAVTLVRHVGDADPQLVVACLLHDSPEFAPPDIALDAVLDLHYGPTVRRIVRALEVEHLALDTDAPIIDTGKRPVLLASTADKIVAVASLLRRAQRSGDVDVFFTARPGLLRLLPHFRAFADAGAGLVPGSMTAQLGRVLTLLTHATARARS